MFSTSLKKSSSILFAIIIAALSMCIYSCQKEISGSLGGSTSLPPDLVTKINSSVSGFVTNEHDEAVNGAVVSAGSSNASTDKYGFFEIKNVQVIKQAAVVSVSQPGYFKGIKTYIAAENKSAFFRIKLIPKTNEGNIDATAGGNVTLANGLTISLPANAVVNAATSTAYSGQINVAAHWLNPVADDLNRTMPGDLRGIDSLGLLKLLTTYGMSAVELTGASGELLQIATGKKAMLTFPLPASLISAAPATIHLWYFDEILGLWKQQGNAIKTGNNYVGEVSHFSYWNCDIPFDNSVQFTATIVDANGQPIPNITISINYANGTYTGAHGYTDSSGFVNGLLPANAQLVINIYSYYGCGNTAYTQNLTTTDVNLSLGNIVLPAASTATVSGNVNNCTGTPVTNGYVVMRKDGMNYRYPISSTGMFDFNVTLCGNNTPVTFIAEDLTTQQAGNVTNFTLTSGANAAGTLIACGNVIDEYINYTINTTSYSITAPADNLRESLNPQSTPTSIYVSGYSMNGGPGAIINSAYFTFTEPGIAVNSTQALQSFNSIQVKDSLLNITTPINVNIIEYGAAGQFIAGNFSGTFTGSPPANTPYVITCNFRVRRN